MKKVYILFLFEVYQILAFSSAKTLFSSRSVLFESADISVIIKTASGERLVEAFNATGGVSDPKLMQWVSLGVPRLLSKPNSTDSSNNSSSNSSKSPFEFVSGGFYMYVETLGADVAKELAKRASLKYNARIEPSQFLPMNKHLWSFECSFRIFVETAQKKWFETLTGPAFDLSNPLMVFFETTKLVAEIPQYERLINEQANSLIIQCIVESYRKECSAAGSQSCETDKSVSGPAFIDRFSLSTKAIAIRAAALVEDSLNETRKSSIDSAIADVEERLRALNQSLESIRSLERNNSKKIACAFGLLDSTASSLLEANVSACGGFAKPTSMNGSAVYTSSGRFFVPIGVNSVRVLVVGGGAGGGSGHAGGGGSGYVQTGIVAVEQFERVTVVVGKGGQASAYTVNVGTQSATAGERSSFGQYLVANGGVAPTNNWEGGAGGSGGGSPSHQNGASGRGGSDGSSGALSWQAGGRGQGTFSSKLGEFTRNSFTAGSGGAGGSFVNGYVGGGGGGGVNMNGTGPTGGNGFIARGGVGYGAGGGGGYHLGGHWFAGGNGADGLVYVEW